MKRSRSRPAALWGGAFLLVCLPAIFLSGLTAARAWKGYFTVLIESSPRLEEKVRALAGKKGIRSLVSRFSSEVSFNSFSGFASITVSRLGERLEAGDPRMDPYLRIAGNLFRAGSWEVIFVRSGWASLFLARTLSRLLAGTGLRWHVLEFDPTASLLRLLFLLAGAFIMLRLPVKGIPLWFAAAGLLPWALCVAAGDLTDLFAFFLIYPLWLRGIELLQRPPRLARLVPLGLAALALALVLLAAPGFRRLPVAGLALAADALLIPILRFRHRSRRGRAPFRALPILQAKLLPGPRLVSIPPITSWTAPVLLAALVFCSPLGVLAAKHLRALEVPILRSGGLAISWGSLARLPLSSAADGLPNLADYVAHRAYQESLAFGRPYGLPSPGERIYLSSYLASGSTIIQARRVAKRFPERWLEELLAATEEGTLERLLVDQGRASPVEARRETAVVFSLRPFLRSAAVAAFLILRLTAAALSGKRSFAL